MFHNARITLTVWYLLILMSISILFSIVIYRQTTVEVERSLRTQAFRSYLSAHPFSFVRPDQIELDSDALAEAQTRIKLLLLFINLGILGLSGAAGYFLAGRTLRPIQNMVDEQHRFITDASHELRTPLTSLRAEIEVGLRSKTMTLAQAKSLLESNLEEVIALQGLSNNLLELAQNGKLLPTQSMQAVSVKQTIETAIKKVQPLAKRNKITLKEYGQDTTITGVPDRLLEVFVILLDNAVKYSNKNSRVTISWKQQKDMVIIEVTDQGIGIASEDIPHVFDRFYRVNKARSRSEVSGYGLGLSIAKKIVEAHKGFISVKSKLGKGSTFQVSFRREL